MSPAPETKKPEKGKTLKTASAQPQEPSPTELVNKALTEFVQLMARFQLPCVIVMRPSGLRPGGLLTQYAGPLGDGDALGMLNAASIAIDERLRLEVRAIHARKNAQRGLS